MKLHIHKYETIKSDYYFYESDDGLPSIIVCKIKKCKVCGKVKFITVDDAEYCSEAARNTYEAELRKCGFVQFTKSVM